jgi:hypothetical protein
MSAETPDIQQLCCLSEVAAYSFTHCDSLEEGARDAFQRLVEERRALARQAQAHLGRHIVEDVGLCWPAGRAVTPAGVRLLHVLATGNARIGQLLEEVLRALAQN